MIIDKIKKEDLKEYLLIAKEIIDFDYDTMYVLTERLIRYYNGNKDEREHLKILEGIEDVWYKSIKISNKNPDYSVYNSVTFIAELWACWKIYSRNYLKLLYDHITPNKKTLLDIIGSDVKGILDLGCGFGYTTGSLKEFFPKSKVFGTNIDNTFQSNVAKHIGTIHDFKVVEDYKTIDNKIDVIFASEYFEHIINPLTHIQNIIDDLQPKYLIIANSFNTRSVGHFNSYENGIDEKKISRLFNNVLRNNNYKKVETKYWNNKPMVWERIQTNNKLKQFTKGKQNEKRSN